MSKVAYLNRAASSEQCRQTSIAEDLVIAQCKIFFAWTRIINRILWGV